MPRAARGGAAESRYSLGTDPDDVVCNAQAFVKLGVEALVVSPNTSDPEAVWQAMDMLAQHVMPACR